MKHINLILSLFIGLIIYFTGCYSFNTSIYNNNLKAVVIDIPPETPDSPAPIYIEPLPVLVPPSYPYPEPVKPVKYRPIQPINHSSNQNVKEERPPAGNSNSRNNSGLRNENSGRR